MPTKMIVLVAIGFLLDGAAAFRLNVSAGRVQQESMAEGAGEGQSRGRQLWENADKDSGCDEDCDTAWY